MFRRSKYKEKKQALPLKKPFKLSLIGRQRIDYKILEELKKELKDEAKRYESEGTEALKKWDEPEPDKDEYQLTDIEMRIHKIPTKEEQQDIDKKDGFVQTAITEIKNDGEAEVTEEESQNQIEKAVGVAINGLVKPEDIRHFSDISKRQAYYISLGEEYCNSIGYPNPKEIFGKIVNYVISSGRKGRTELKEVGVAGVNREKTGVMDRFKDFFTGNRSN
jgi:hypothetical protein